MNKKRKFILSLSGLAICLALSIYAILFVLDAPYRKGLPEYPDFKNISKTLQQQISGAGLMTYLNPTVANLGELGMVYHSGSYSEEAISCYQLAEKKSKREWIWSYYLGYLNLEQGDSKAAIENFRRVLEKNPNNHMALFYTGEAFMNMGSTANAENIFKRIAALNDHPEKTNRENYFPLQTYAMFRLARIYTNSNRLDSAEMTLNETIKKQWKFGPAYRLLGDVYTKKGNQDLGKNLIIRSNDLPSYTPPEDTLIDRIALISRSDQYLLKLIDVAKTNYNFNWALKLCTHALKYLPENKYLISNAIIVYFVLDLDKQELLLLDKHLKYFSDDFIELMNFADLIYAKGYEPQAMKYFEQAKKLQPESSKLPLWLSHKNRKNEAVILLDAQLKKDPDNERMLVDAAHIYMNIGMKEMAMTILARLKKLYPSSLEAKKIAGSLFEMEGNQKEALSIYEEISRNDPKDLAIMKNLATLYIRNKMWDKAIHNFRLALENYPNEPDILDGLGSLLISCPDQKLRNVIEGREYCERAFIHYKCTPAFKIEAAKYLATAYAMLGDKQKASWFINITLNMAGKVKNPSKESYYKYFDMLKKQYNISN